ncbi:hypothetical protein V8G29_004540 [Salmonella enterica]
MPGNATVKQNGKTIGKISLKRPSYNDVAQNYLSIFPTPGSVNPVFYAYFYIGGQVYKEHLRDPKAYGNACALRVSYALNISGMRIPEKVSVLPVTRNGGNRILRGGKDYVPDGDKLYYIYSVENMISFLEYAWGKPDKSINVPKGVSQLDSLKKMNKKGVIIFYISGYNDATGHATIWDGEKCLDGSTYYDPATHPNQTLTYIKFWELK